MLLQKVGNCLRRDGFYRAVIERHVSSQRGLDRWIEIVAFSSIPLCCILAITE